MIKKTITYENFDGEEKTVEAYFHLSKTEAILLASEKINGVDFADALKNIIDAEDLEAMLKVFKRMIIMSYGRREGERFIKNDGEEGKAFSETPAFDALFTELVNSENGLVEFFHGILPKTPAKPTLEVIADNA